MSLYKLKFVDRVVSHQGHERYVGYKSGGDVTLLDFYPVGTLYKSVNADFDPNVTFGGTWITTNFEGRTPVGFFDSNSITGVTGINRIAGGN